MEFDNKDFQVRIAGAPYQDGNEWVYTCFIADGQAASFIPGDLLLPGKQVSRVGSAYEEYSEEGDILNYNTHFKMRNFLFTTRLDYDITGTAYSTVLAIALKDPKSGKTSYLWSDYQTWKAMQEWSKRCEYMMVYSKSNRNADGTTSLKGTNGRPVYIPAGVLEQIAPANKRSYTDFTLDLLEDFLSDLGTNVLNSSERKFIVYTGEEGMKLADRAMKAKAATLNLVDTKFIGGSGQALSLGGQFVTYRMVNGYEVTFKHLPLFDDPYHNRQLDPVTGKPLESSKFMILDMSRKDGMPNVTKVVRKDREFVMWNTSGSVAPGAGYGKSASTVRSNAKDGYSVHLLGEMGVFLRDPRACGILYKDAE